jgi:NAD-dependent dihydropyrimidine dehydrogenase PreA subunit
MALASGGGRRTAICWAHHESAIPEAVMAHRPRLAELCVGTPAQEQDFAQSRQGRADAHRFGMPLVVWAYPRGSAIEGKGRKGFVLRGRLRRAHRVRVELEPGDRYAIDLDYCKGCGICVAECPCGAIEMVPEEI